MMPNWKPFEKLYLVPSENQKIIVMCIGNGLNFQRATQPNQKLLFPTPFCFLQLYSEEFVSQSP